MGQKVSPVGLRVGVNRDWDSRWYANKNDVPALLHEDIKIREFLDGKFGRDISRVEIERSKGREKDRVSVFVHTATPGIILGRDSETKNKVVSNLEYLTKKEIVLNVVEIKNPDCDAQLVAFNIAKQLENRASFRRVQKFAIQRAMRNGAKGIKTLVSGRLGGADMARGEGYSEGRVPLHTLRADIDYATAEADTTYGKLGIKVWIYRGEILKGQKRKEIVPPRRNNNRRPNNNNRRPRRDAQKGGN